MTDAWWQNDPVVASNQATTGGDWWKRDPVTTGSQEGGGKPLSWSDVASRAWQNAPASGARFAEDIARPFIHPIDTVKSLKNLGEGVLEKTGLMSGHDEEKFANAFGGYFKDRYGSLQGFKHAVASDPVGVLGDLSTVLTLGGGAAARTPGLIGKAGEIAATVGDAANPAVWAAKGAGMVARPAVDAVRRVGSSIVRGIPGIESAPHIGSRVTDSIERAAQQKLLDQSSDPNALRAWAGADAGNDLVSGSPRTTASAVGNDRGLFQAEKDARNANNVPFNALDEMQNGAHIAALRGVQPEGDVFLPGQMLRRRMDEIDTTAQDAEDRLTAAHQEAVTRRAQATQDFLRQHQNRTDATLGDLTRQAGETQAAAEARARTAASGLGEGTNAEDVGSQLRTSIEDVRAATKKAHNALFDAVDPDGTLSLVATPVRDKAREIYRQLKDDGSEFGKVEAPLFRRAAVLKDVTQFRKIRALDRDIGAAMSEERRTAGESPAWGRLVQLKSAVKDAMVQAVDNQARHEAQQVAEGRMANEDTIGFQLSQQAQDFLASRDQQAAASTSGGGPSNYAGGPSAAVLGTRGTAREAGGRFGNAAGDQGIPEAPLQPNFDDAARQRLKQANSAYANYAQTYKNPIVGPGLRTTGYSGQYRVPDAAFIKRAIIPGDRGYEVAVAHLKAAGNSPEAVSAMKSSILYPLRKTTLPTGTIHPKALARWKERYGGALRALDEVSPGFSRRFDDAAGATQSLLDISAQNKQAIADFEKEAAARALSLRRERLADDATLNAQSKTATADKIAGVRQEARDARNTPAGQFATQGGDRISPVEVENAVGNILKTGTSGVTRMRSLVQSVSENPAALAGLRRAGVDYLLRSFSNADGTLSGARFIKFVRDNNDVLKELYGPEHVSTINAIAGDLEANSRWRTETAIKAGSDTAKNLKPMLEKALEEGKRHVSIMSAATAGFLAGGAKGALTGGLLYLINSLHSAGIRKVDDLYREALLNPKVARALIQKMPSGADMSKLRSLDAILQRAAIVGPLAIRMATKGQSAQ